MFKITNNNISITRGETATYDAVFKHSDGTPLILDKNLVSGDKSIYGLFSVKLSMYDEDAVFRVPMKLDDLATFDTSADVISIGDETFSDANVPDAYSKFVDNSKYDYFLYNISSVEPNFKLVFNTKGNFPFVCKESGKLYYFLSENVSNLTRGLYEYNGTYWVKNSTLTSAIPAYYAIGEVGADNSAHSFTIGNETYISGYFDIAGTRTYKVYLFDDTSVTPITEITFTGVSKINIIDNLWSDGTNYFCSNGVKTYQLNTSTYEFTEITLNYNVQGYSVWQDGDNNVYYTNGSICKKWDKTNLKWDDIASSISYYDVSNYNVPVLINGKVYFNDKILVSATAGLEWVDLEEPLNKPHNTRVWYYGTDTICSPRVYTSPNKLAVISTVVRDERLYKRVIASVPYYYQYVGTTVTVTEDDFEEYEFRLVFPFPYDVMKNLQPKLYKYEIALVGGTPSDEIVDQQPITTLPLDIDFKKYLVEFKDFKVEGSLSE